MLLLYIFVSYFILYNLGKPATKASESAPPPLVLSGHGILKKIYFEFQKKLFFHSNPAFTPPPPLLVARPIKQTFLRLLLVNEVQSAHREQTKMSR